MTKTKQRFPIYAGMPFNNSKDIRMKIVGYKIMEFTFNQDGQLIGEKEILRIFI